jgi:hypothetical protein
MPELFRLIGDPSDSTYYFEVNPDATRYEPAFAPKVTKAAKVTEPEPTDPSTDTSPTDNAEEA